LLTETSEYFFGKPSAKFQSGFTFPALACLHERFPHSQYFVTGAQSPVSNVGGPNEHLDVIYAQKLMACLAHILTGITLEAEDVKHEAERDHD